LVLAVPLLAAWLPPSKKTMTLVQDFKVDESIALIKQMLEGHPRPCVLWSGGRIAVLLPGAWS
jgi:hypothetical protein